MSQPITHYYVAKYALTNTCKDLFDNYGSYVGLGTFGPDLFYLTKQAEYADMIHANYSFDSFCAMLDHVKINWNSDYDTAGKQLGFALGFYAHVITDCIFHPYVYRIANDYWHVPKPQDFEEYEWKHKKIEAIIDHRIMEEVVHPSFRSIDINCGDGNLDLGISGMLYDVLGNVYGIPGDLTERAYQRFCYAIPTLYSGQNILYRLDDFFERVAAFTRTQLIIEDLNELEMMNMPWPPVGSSSLLDYNAIDLLNMAIRAVSNIVPVVYGFIDDSNTMDCQSYLSSSGILYLDGNWNLDTGLPSSWNQYSPLFNPDNTRFDIAVDLLQTNYNSLR